MVLSSARKGFFLRTGNFSISLTMSRFIRMRSRNLALEESGLISFDLVLTKVYTGVSFVNGNESPLCQFVNWLKLPTLTNDRCAFQRIKPTNVSFAFIPTYVPPCKTHISPFSPICCKMPPIFWRIINFHPIINILNCNDQ